MDKALNDLAQAALLLNFFNQALARGDAVLASSQTFARTEELSNAAFSSALYGLLGLMQPPANPAPAAQLASKLATASEIRDVAQMYHSQPLAVS